ncbi:hypothetical protein [Massilia sp. 9096]|uniref:hypothetical protein n=1 Tax=Massilia sp. 9096 TaxID=1500894 RepID=UPI000565217D|nr:hypothetical protein [Massilia sp. 9096]
MSTTEPTKVGDKWMVHRDPDEISWYAADITDELLDRNTTLATTGQPVTLILQGVTMLRDFSIQTATIGGVVHTYIVVLLGGVDTALPADWLWTARCSCANGERFDKTTWFQRVDT